MIISKLHKSKYFSFTIFLRSYLFTFKI